MDQNINEIKQKTLSGLFWRFGERILAQLISFIVSVILARILMPEEYGLIAIVSIFINLANVFVTSGLGTSLIQKKEVDDLDFSTMLYASVFLSIILYAILFLASPFIAKVYNNELLEIVLKIFGIKLPIAAINSIQQAYVSREMTYKKFFFSNLIGTLISAVIGIYMAYSGFGVWALVVQYLSSSIINTVVLSITNKWKPILKFSFDRFKSLFSYGWKITCASLIGTIFDQLRGFIIGIKYTSADLAYNNKGEQIPALISNNINATMESVLFSSISKVQDSKENVKKAISRLMKTSSFIIFPMLIGLSAVAETLVKILITDKWLPCVPFLRIVCFQQCFSILNSVNMQAIKAVGRSDILLKLEFIKKPIFISILFITMMISPIAMCLGNAIYAIIALFINSYHNKNLLNYSIFEQIKDTWIYFVLSIIMGIAVVLIGEIQLNIYALLILQVTIGAFFYIAFSKLLNLDSLQYIINIIKGLFKKTNRK